MVVEFTTTYAISAHHYLSCEFVSRSGEVYLIQFYVIKFVNDLHRCQPLRFFHNCYEFRAKITVLRSTVYLLRISDYCRPRTVPHLNIIVII